MRGRVNRRDFIAPFSSAATWPLAAGAQKPPKIPRVGYLGSVTPRRAGTAGSRHSTTGSETRATWKGKRSRWKSTVPIPAVAIHAIFWRETEVAARKLGVALQPLEVRGPGDFEAAFAAATQAKAQALIAFDDSLTGVHRSRIVALAANGTALCRRSANPYLCPAPAEL